MCHNLTSLPTQRNPYPHLVGLLDNKRPQLIKLEHMCFRVGGIGREKRRTQCWEVLGFFFIQAVTVLRDTPKIRETPRKLLRSSVAFKISARRCSVYPFGDGFSRLCRPHARHL